MRKIAQYSVFIVTLISIMGVSTIVPALPALQREFSLRTEQVGWILTIFTLPGVFLAPFAGILADTYGRRAVLIPSLLIFGITGVLCAVASSYTVLLVLRCVQGVGVSALNLLTNIILSDMYEGKQRTRMLGYNAMVLGLGTGLMPFVGGICASLHWRVPFVLSIIALPVALLCWYLPYIKTQKVVSLKAYFSGVSDAIRSKRMIALFYIAFGTFLIVYGPIVTYYPLYVHALLHLSAFWIGCTYSSFALSTTLATMILPRLLHFFTSLVIMRIAHVIYIASMALFVCMYNVYMAIAALLLYGAAQGLNYANLVSLVSNEATETNRGIILALQGMIFRLSQTCAPLFFGFAYIQYNYSGVYILGIITAVSMLFAACFFVKEKSVSI